jgi:hypothetical protein
MTYRFLLLETYVQPVGISKLRFMLTQASQPPCIDELNEDRTCDAIDEFRVHFFAFFAVYAVAAWNQFEHK